MRKLFVLLGVVGASVALADAVIPPPELVGERADAPCLTCAGAGRRLVIDRGIQSNRAIPHANKDASLAQSKPLEAKVACNDCGSKGHLVREVTAEERVELQRARRQKYDRTCLEQGCVPVGSAYMKREAADALSPEAYAEQALRFPKRCEECLGLKVEACNKCDGTGKITKRERTKKREKEVQIACTKCRGSGSVQCRRCKGEGLAKLCKRCSGTGVAKTRARKNQSAGTERCHSCDGNGRK